MKPVAPLGTKRVILPNQTLTGLAVGLLGLVGAFSIAWPLDWLLPRGAPVWWLQLFSMVGFFALLRQQTRAGNAFAMGALYNTAMLAGTVAWLYIAMNTYAGLAAWMAVLAVLALSAFLSLYYGMAAWLWHRYQNKNASVQALAFAALWTAAELARGTWFTGFGWGAGGYAHIDGPLATYAPWVGVYGVGALAVWTAASLLAKRQAARWNLVAVIAVWVLGAGWQAYVHQQTGDQGTWSTTNGSISVTLLQGNVAQSEKFEESVGIPAAIAWYVEQVRQSKTALIVAPETAIPILLQDLQPADRQAIRAHLDRTGSAFLTGVPMGDYQSGYTNSVWAIQGGNTGEYQYDKHHLVPFGEFIPPLFRWFTQLMQIPLGDFNRGPLGQPPFAFARQRIAPNICFEDLFGEELGERFRDAAQAPTLFVNVSNMGWFGPHMAINQHLNISRMRALEFERPFIRATNTGATVIIDHRANVVAALPNNTRGALTGTVQGRTGLTPYAWWIPRFGLWPLWGIIALTLGLCWRSRKISA